MGKGHDDLLHVCRICAKKADLIHIETNPTISTLLWSLLQLSPQNELKFICNLCWKTVKAFSEFKKQGQKSDNVLRSFCIDWEKIQVKDENQEEIWISDSEASTDVDENENRKLALEKSGKQKRGIEDDRKVKRAKMDVRSKEVKIPKVEKKVHSKKPVKLLHL